MMARVSLIASEELGVSDSSDTWERYPSHEKGGRKAHASKL